MCKRCQRASHPNSPSSFLSSTQRPLGLKVLPSRRMKLPFPFFLGPSLRVEIMTFPSARQWVVCGVPTPRACISQGSMIWEDELIISWRANEREKKRQPAPPCPALGWRGRTSRPRCTLCQTPEPEQSAFKLTLEKVFIRFFFRDTCSVNGKGRRNNCYKRSTLKEKGVTLP